MEVLPIGRNIWSCWRQSLCFVQLVARSFDEYRRDQLSPSFLLDLANLGKEQEFDQCLGCCEAWLALCVLLDQWYHLAPIWYRYNYLSNWLFSSRYQHFGLQKWSQANCTISWICRWWRYFEEGRLTFNVEKAIIVRVDFYHIEEQQLELQKWSQASCFILQTSADESGDILQLAEIQFFGKVFG